MNHNTIAILTSCIFTKLSVFSHLSKTTTAPTEIPDSASTISLLAFYSVVIIGITIAFMA